MEEKVQRKKG
jgi:hypothetical protein